MIIVVLLIFLGYFFYSKKEASLNKIVDRILQYENLVKEKCIDHNLDIDSNYILAMMCQESGGFEKAYRGEPYYYTKFLNDTQKNDLLLVGINESNFGSRGLMQILDSNSINYYPNVINFSEWYNVDININMSIKHFKGNLQYTKSNVHQAIRCYNGGNSIQGLTSFQTYLHLQRVLRYYNLLKQRSLR